MVIYPAMVQNRDQSNFHRCINVSLIKTKQHCSHQIT